MIVFSQNYFYINTNNSSYIMQIMPDGILRHCYYGKKIKNHNMDYFNLYTSLGFDYTAPYNSNNEITTMDALSQECPSCGRGDYRSPSVIIENSNGRNINEYKYLSHTVYSGVPVIAGMPHLESDNDSAETLEIVMKDFVSGVQLHLYYTVFDEIDIIARHIKIENITDETVFINKAMSMSLDFENNDFKMLSLYGKWANERCNETYDLHHGETIISSTRGATGHSSCPFAALVGENVSEEHGEVYAVSLIYSGNFKISAQIGQFDTTRFSAGINDDNFSWELKPGEDFSTPQAVLTYSYKGLGQMSRNFHELCRNHLGASAEKRKHPIVLNMWEAFYFEVTEQKAINTINAASDFGIDTLVLDDGWFGKRESELTSLGDWYVNTDKFPNGLSKLTNLCKDNGLNFGLWFEPEVISPESELYKKHPDWCIHLDGISPVKSRSEYLLDLSRSEVVDAVYAMISQILSEYDISYVKWDMNRNMTDNGSSHLGVRNQGEHAHRYILGVYSLMQRLRNAFPAVFFEGSAGGGGRFDFGMLYYMHQIWTSDNTDAMQRMNIQYGTSLLFPPEVQSCHVSDCPNHQTGRITPFKSRADVAQLFSFGYEFDPNVLNAEQKELLITQTAKHRKLEKWIYDATFYRLKKPWKNESSAWQMVSSDKKHSAVVYATRLTNPKKVGEYLKVTGLDKDKSYRVLPYDITVNGSTLMYAGLPIKEQYNDFTTLFFDIEEVDS